MRKVFDFAVKYVTYGNIDKALRVGFGDSFVFVSNDSNSKRTSRGPSKGFSTMEEVENPFSVQIIS